MSGCLFISGRTGACVGRSAVRRISGCRREPLLLSDNFPALGYALDRDVIIGGSIGGIKLDGSLPQIIELDDRIPVKRRAIVGRVGSIFLFGVVCRRVKLRRGFDNPMALLRLRPAMVQRHTLRPALFPFSW